MNCKPGDLAFVRCHSTDVDNGKIVRILRAAKDGDRFVPNGGRYIHAPEAGPVWWCAGKNLHYKRRDGTGLVGGQTEVAYLDSRLIPIRPGDVTDEEVRDLYAPDRSMKDSPPSEAKQPNKKETV